MWYLPYQLVQDFFHQQYCMVNPGGGNSNIVLFFSLKIGFSWSNLTVRIFFSDGLVETTTNQECVGVLFKSIDDKFHVENDLKKLQVAVFDDGFIHPKTGSLDPPKWRHFEDQTPLLFRFFHPSIGGSFRSLGPKNDRNSRWFWM